MLDQILVITCTLSLLIIGYLFISRRWIFAPIVIQDDDFPLQLTITADQFDSCPEIIEYRQALKEAVEANATVSQGHNLRHTWASIIAKESLQQWQARQAMLEQLYSLLLQRAKADLLIGMRWEAEVNNYYGMYRYKKISELQWNQLLPDVKDFRDGLEAEKKEVAAHAQRLRPGMNHESAIFQEAYDQLLVEHNEHQVSAVGRGGEESGVNGFVSSKLLFKPGSRVRCFMGDEAGWKLGTVKIAYELPYQVDLDDGAWATAGRDSEQLIQNAEESEESQTKLDTTPPSPWVPLRLKLGQRVMCNMGKDHGWKRGVVLPPPVSPDMLSPEPQKERYPVYFVCLDNGTQANAPVDIPECIRECLPEELEQST